MNDRLRTALRSVLTLDTTLRPVPFAAAREAALVEGLHALAAEYGHTISFTHINANGEMAFNVEGAYGAPLAAVLSRVPRRTGTSPTTAPVLPESNWCYLNHFEVERLLRIIAAENSVVA